MENHKRFKSNSMAEAQEIIRRHVYARSEITTVLPAFTMISPSGRRMRGSRPSQAQNRTLDEMEEQTELQGKTLLAF